VEPSYLEFVIPADNESYVDLDIKLHVRDKLVNSNDGKDNDAKDFSRPKKNFLQSLFKQCGVTLNGVSITSASGYYNHRAYLETLLTYRRDAVTSHLTNSMFHLDDGDMLDATNKTNARFVVRWN
jgi:hypothetical protein